MHCFDYNYQLNVIFLDLQKALDTQRAFIKTTIGISEVLLSCYLTNRVHRVALDSCCSCDLSVTSGVRPCTIHYVNGLFFMFYFN